MLVLGSSWLSAPVPVANHTGRQLQLQPDCNIDLNRIGWQACGPGRWGGEITSIDGIRSPVLRAATGPLEQLECVQFDLLRTGILNSGIFPTRCSSSQFLNIEIQRGSSTRTQPVVQSATGDCRLITTNNAVQFAHDNRGNGETELTVTFRDRSTSSACTQAFSFDFRSVPIKQDSDGFVAIGAIMGGVAALIGWCCCVAVGSSRRYQELDKAYKNEKAEALEKCKAEIEQTQEPQQKIDKRKAEYKSKNPNATDEDLAKYLELIRQEIMEANECELEKAVKAFEEGYRRRDARGDCWKSVKAGLADGVCLGLWKGIISCFAELANSQKRPMIESKTELPEKPDTSRVYSGQPGHGEGASADLGEGLDLFKGQRPGLDNGVRGVRVESESDEDSSGAPDGLAHPPVPLPQGRAQ